MIHKNTYVREVIIFNIENLVLKNHLTIEVEKVIDFNKVY